jgi:hypothetical protein
VIAATFEYDELACRPSDRFGAEMRAIIELMRWTDPDGKEMKRVRKRLAIRLRRSHEISHRNTVV